jgi:hypothetical protein
VSRGAPALHPIDAPGTAERAWAAWPWLSAPPGAGLTGLARRIVAGAPSALVVAAHPDDEVLGVGGLMSVLAAAGARLRLVAVTDGELSHRGHADPGELARQRTAETAAALRAAIGCFASQASDRGHGLGPVLPAEMTAHFTRATEVLLQ